MIRRTLEPEGGDEKDPDENNRKTIKNQARETILKTTMTMVDLIDRD